MTSGCYEYLCMIYYIYIRSTSYYTYNNKTEGNEHHKQQIKPYEYGRVICIILSNHRRKKSEPLRAERLGWVSAFPHSCFDLTSAGRYHACMWNIFSDVSKWTFLQLYGRKSTIIGTAVGISIQQQQYL